MTGVGRKDLLRYPVRGALVVRGVEGSRLKAPG